MKTDSHPFSPPRLGRRAVVAGLGLAPLLTIRPQAAPMVDGTLAMHGESEGISRLAYVREDAPKGGRFVFPQAGSFDSLNPYVLRGTLGYGVRQYVHQTLLGRYYDAPFTLYAAIAEAVEMADDRSAITFRLNPLARFSDGAPLTAEDVAFSWNLLKEKGRPNQRAAYGKVKAAIIEGPHRLRFDLSGANDWELPLILGLMPVLPRHGVDAASFSDTLSRAIIGSGPYQLEDVKLGDRLVFRRDPQWWARDLPLHRGLHNFDEIRVIYYRDSNTLFEALKTGDVDFRLELDPARWAKGYDFPASRDGRVKRMAIPLKTPKGFNAIAFNARKAPLNDIRVRQALTLLFDGEWVNRTLFAGLYGRSFSIFEDSELSARARRADADERALLASFGARLDEAVLAGLDAPRSDGSGNDRATLRAALALLKQAGYELQNGQMTGPSGPLSLALILKTKEEERIALAFQQFAARAGIAVEARMMDAAQFEERMKHYDFDLAPYTWWNNSLSPGNEQTLYWSPRLGREPGSRNVCGIDDPLIDTALEALVQARSRPALVTACRALDRLLQAGAWWLPLFHVPEQWIAVANHVQMPDESSLFGYLPETWWSSKAGG